jgi:hypothetical protein
LSTGKQYFGSRANLCRYRVKPTAFGPGQCSGEQA